jgi:NADH-quinone oxidoreductase subunit M
MFASVGLPGLSGFVGEFLSILGVWREYRWAGVISFFVVILSAWYMMWMFQRVIFGRAAGEAPDPHDGALTDDERAMLADHGHGHGHGHAVPAVSGGSGHDDREPEENLDSEHVPDVHASDAHARGGDDHGAHGADAHHDGDHAHGHAIAMPDVNPRELATLVPLVILTIVMGVYPQLFMDAMQATFEAILQSYGGNGI